jgi:hypothetical protein
MSELDDLFAKARNAAPEPSDALMARVMADAERVLSQRQGAALTSSQPSPGLFERLLRLIGGAAPVTGPVLAGLAGLAIGYLQPESLAGLTDILAYDAPSVTMDLMPGPDALLPEE